MKLDARLRNGLAFAAADARDAEEAGYDGAWSSENESDAFLPLALAAGATARIELGPSVAIAFSRTPMTVAYQAADLQRFSDGRFVLGLGSQIRPHIEKRFSMPWSRPAARMREFVLALRAIFRCWEEGEPLRFEGEFYRHTLMTPHFSPPPVPGGPPPIYLAAVGPLMTEVAGEVADGLLAHPFLTVDYLRDVVLPAVEAVGPRPAARWTVSRSACRRSWPSTTPTWRRCAARSRSTAPPRHTGRYWTTTAGASCRPSSTRCPSRGGGTTWCAWSTTTCWRPCAPSAAPPRWPPNSSSATGPRPAHPLQPAR
ncbi:MAG: TIGR03617 family F420-dependent LLM class oxidoreductase [Acidimicrobiales bacterium]